MMYNVIMAIVETFGMFAVGGLAMWLKIIEEKDLNKLGRLIIDILFPMMVFASITKNFDPTKLDELWIMPLLGFGLMLFGGIAGFGFRYCMTNRTPERMATFHHYCAINNYLFLPYIILANLWGQEYIPLLLIMNIGSTIGFWTIGIATMGGANLKQTIKNIFSINQIAVVLALIFCFVRIPVPVVIMTVFTKLGDASVPLMLMVIGAALFINAHQTLQNKFDVLCLSVVRLVIIPLMIIFILKLLPLPEAAYRVTFVVALMPVSVSSAMIARRFGGDPNFAGQSIIVTTLASIITIPLMMHLL